jgi:hypothetical protein
MLFNIHFSFLVHLVVYLFFSKPYSDLKVTS